MEPRAAGEPRRIGGSQRRWFVTVCAGAACSPQTSSSTDLPDGTGGEIQLTGLSDNGVSPRTRRSTANSRPCVGSSSLGTWCRGWESNPHAPFGAQDFKTAQSCGLTSESINLLSIPHVHFALSSADTLRSAARRARGGIRLSPLHGHGGATGPRARQLHARPPHPGARVHSRSVRPSW